MEAASLSKPLLFGPHLSNFREIARALREGGGAREVLNESELVTVCAELLADEALRARMSAACSRGMRTIAGPSSARWP